MKTILKLLVLLLIFSSCEKRYSINADKIICKEAMKDGFQLSELVVSAVDKDGRPSKYIINQTVFCGPLPHLSGFYEDKVYNDVEKNIRTDAWKIMDSIAKLNGNTIGGEGHEKGIEFYHRSEQKRDSIEKLHFPFTAQDVIYFYKANKYYKWVLCINQGDLENAYDYSKGAFEINPMQFKIEQWYMFDFSTTNHIIDKVFFYLEKDKKIHQYDYYSAP